MPDWRATLQSLATELEAQFDRRNVRVAGVGGAAIAPYRGFGRAGELLVRGRVLLERKITRVDEAEPIWRNMLNAYRRFGSREIPRAKVRARYRDAVMETVSDDEGYFHVRLEPRALDLTQTWHEVGLELTDTTAVAIAPVLVPSQAATFGVISDIDDTVLQTGATDLISMVKTVFFENARTRLPFEGVADLYRALHVGVNPIFYVSSSPWNLYDLLHDFMELNSIPHGPMLLQDFGLDEAKLIHAPHDTHKLEQIRLILDYYPHLPFVLLGDSGQRDPEIYLEVIRANPGRIKLALIRDVTEELRDRAVAAIIEESNAAGVEMLYVKTSKDALEHVRKRGLAT